MYAMESRPHHTHESMWTHTYVDRTHAPIYVTTTPLCTCEVCGFPATVLTYGHTPPEAPRAVSDQLIREGP